MNYSLTLATPSMAAAMSKLAMRAKAYWGYSHDFMAQCETELTVHQSDISAVQWHHVVAINDEALLGFYACQVVDSDKAELDALFVQPEWFGVGIGKALFNDCVAYLGQHGIATLCIQSDPNAAAFYRAVGAHHVGQRASGSIRGRRLPVFEFDVTG